MRGFQPKGPDGVILYAVGDIHGRADLLGRLVMDIRADAHVSTLARRPILLFLGDYVDRGPDSRKVLDALVALQKDGVFATHFLRGNHDLYLLDFLEDGETGPRWMTVGGGATLLSYGVTPPRLSADRAGWRDASTQMRAAVPAEHLDLLVGASDMATFGDYLFVHAGVRPGVPLERQTLEDVTTIRRPFLSSRKPVKGKVVVFGHTPFEAPRVKPNAIGIDTGAYLTGVLTALRIFEAQRTFLSTSPETTRPQDAAALKRRQA